MPSAAGKVDLCERFMTLESVRLVDEQGLNYLERLGGMAGESTTWAKVLSEFATLGIDWDPALLNINSWFDRLVAAMNEKDHADRAKKLAELDKEIKELKAKCTNPWTLAALPLSSGKEKGKVVGDIMISLLMPALQKIQIAWERSQQTEANLLVAFALAAYLSDEKHYPKELSELSPKYLKEIPKDLLSGKALNYQPSAAGYTLYSVGPNGKDEQGRNQEGTPPGDDIGIVMPLPALKKQ